MSWSVVFVGTIWSAFEGGILGVAAFFAACLIIYRAVRWFLGVANQVGRVHAVILGSDTEGEQVPGLVDRLEGIDVKFERGEQRMARIEASIEETRGKVVSVERSMDVLAADERQEIRKALVVAAEGRGHRRSNDPPPRAA